MTHALQTLQTKIKICFPLFFFFLALSIQSFSQTPIYSRGGGGNSWTNIGAWSLTGHAGGSCGCVPTAGHDVKIGAGHTITIASNFVAVANSIEINSDGAGGTLVLGNNGDNALTLTTGNLTINTGGILRMGGNGNGIHSVVINGSIVNDGTVDLVGANGDVANVTSGGTVPKSFSGTPTQFDFNGLTVAGSNASISLSSDINIFGALNWTSNGLIVVDANSSITLGPTATVTNSGTNRYVQLDGTSGTNSEFIKTGSSTTVASWQIVFPVGTAIGGYTPLDLSAGGGATINAAPANNSLLKVKPIYNPSEQGQLRRQFRLAVTGNGNATTFTNADFYYNPNPGMDLSTGDLQADYTTPWMLNNATGVWTALTGNAPGTTFFTAPLVAQTLATGTYYYTIGNATAFTNTWYSYQTGVWSDPEVWTQDPSGTSFVNPSNSTPSSGDVVVILNGYTVTSDVNNRTLNATTIQGGAVLDMSTTTGHNLGTVTGTGILRVKGATLPTGIYTSFVSTSGGTIEYYDVGGTLTSQATYNKLLLSNSTGSNITFVSANNLTINGTLNITQTSGAGSVTWQINNATAVSRTISVAGDLTVSSNGRITVGTGNSGSTTQHSVILYGNLTNNGSVQFYDPTDAALSSANYTSGAIYSAARRGNAANVTFSGVTDQTVTANGVTDFYRLIVDKGTGQQAMLTVNSSNVANFRLFGPCNRDMSGAAPDYISNNALSLVNGTLQLTGTITIPTLVINGGGGIGGGWPIPQDAALWVNSPGVSITVTNSTDTGDNGRQMYVFGKLQLSSGNISMGYSRGLLGGGSGIFVIEGGTLNTRQLRTTYLGSNNRFSYTQTGGTVNVGTTGITGADVNTYPRFALPYAECSFTMSGGTLRVANPTTSGTSINGGILIFAASSNISVTGGQVNAILPASATNFTITSTAPFYNLNIQKTGAGASVATLAATSFNDGSGFTRAVQPLTVLNNLTIESTNNAALTCNNNNVTIGGNFDIQSGATFTPGTNTITFNGTSTQTWSYNGTIPSLNNVVMNKTGLLQLAGSTLPIIEGLALTSGTLDDGGNIVTVHLTISNSATHQGTGSIGLNGPTVIDGNNGTFGNLSVNSNSTVAVAGVQTITGTLRLINTSSSLNIGTNNLTVLGPIYSNTGTAVAFTNVKRIITNGARNDGGLTRPATLGQTLLFPVGTNTVPYTPASIRVDAATTVGRITVRAVKTVHPNVTTPTASLQYFWRVTSTGFSGVTDVTHIAYSFSTATKNGTLTDYHAARYDPNAFTWAYQTAAFNATAATSIPNFETGTGWTGLSSDQLDGEYTAGNPSAFGPVVVYYSRVASGNWGTAGSWSNVAINGTAAASTPCSACPVVIGDASNNHTININANNQSCGSLSVATGSVLDCGAFTGLNMGVSAPVGGNGKIRLGSANFPSGDFLNFMGTSGGTIEWYGPAYTIPSVGPAPQNISLATYYNLQITPNNNVSITMPANDLTIHNNLTISGATATGQVNTNTGGTRNITIANDLEITSGILSVRNGAISNFIVNGNTTVATSASFILQNGGGTRTHTLTTPGNLTNNGTVLFRSGTGNEFLNLTFTGTTNTSLTGTNAAASTTLNNIVVNKGASQTPTLVVDVAGTVVSQSNNWLTLTNGTINFNKTGGAFTLTNTATNPFSIPSNAKLRVSAGTVTVSDINNDNSDVLLAGAIEVSGGTLTVGNGSNNNNDIEYASAGLPTIIVSSGVLTVNGAIRRPTTTLAGALVYNQSGGTVTVAGRDAINTRGVFEIENSTGSRFNLTGTSSLSILRPTGGTQFTDLYLNPDLTSVSSTSTIYLGIAGTTQTIDINVVPSLGNLLIYENTTASMQSSTLTTTGTLTINTAAATLLTNSLDVTIGGNLSINGTGVYNGTIGSGNTTVFNGTGPQSAALSSGSTFLNMTVNKPSGTVSLSGTSPTITNLNILSGVLDVNSLNLSVIGNIVNNSSQINTGGTGSISLAGGTTVTSQNITSTGGSFGNLTLTGAASTKTVNVTGNITINGTLAFSTTNRFFSVGSSRVTFGVASSVTGQGSNAFIRTNGVASDLGVVKNWPAGSTTFVYPIGTRTNYTPVTLTLNVTTPGDLTIIPVDDRHPTANTGSTERILNYYWVITRGSTLVYSATGSHQYAFPATLMGGALGTITAGYLDIESSTPGWITSGHGGTATTSSMLYTNLLNTNLPTAGNTFHYSVGTVNTLPNPIIPIYSRLADASVANVNVGGDWNDTNSWTLASDGMGPAWGSIPYGNSVVILPNSRINISTTGRISFITQVDGLIVLPSNKVGHNFGIIRGTGTIRTTTSTLPAGNYTTFVSSAGGTLEYVGPMTMNNRTTYNHLSVIGTGNVTMTNSDLTLNGNLTIASGATLNNATNNRNISIAGNWTNNGTFTQGTGTVTFSGGSAQTQGGSTNTTFYNLAVSKSANNVTLSTGTATTVTNNLTLTSRHIIASTSHPLVLGTSTITGGSASSFIGGTVSKFISGLAAAYSMPLGDAASGNYRPAAIGNASVGDTWTFEYVGHDPTTDGYDNWTFDNTNLRKVSEFEYWNISRSGGAAVADLTLTYNTGSYIPPNIGDMSSLRLVKWNTGTSQWELATGVAPSAFVASGTVITGTVFAPQVTSFSPHTFGSTDPASPLPVELTYFSAKLVNDEVQLKWETASEMNNDFFTVERTTNPEYFESIIKVPGHGTTPEVNTYTTVDTSPIVGLSYYRLKQTDYDGRTSYSKPQPIQYEGPEFTTLYVYPNPSNGQSIVVKVVGLKNEQQVPLEIINAHGQTVYSNVLAVKTKGVFNEEIVLTNPLKAGFYIVKAGPYLQMIRKLVVE
jgi:fibronectin-binding autotransporter adhesin